MTCGAAPPPVIVLAAHGERRGPGTNRRLHALAAALQARLPDTPVRPSRVNEPASTLTAIAGAERAIVLPVLFSDGFFYTRLRSEVSESGWSLAPPLALWPEFAPFLSRQIDETGAPVLLVAHGSKRPGRSSAVAIELAGTLAADGRDVRCGFLEEQPFAAAVAAEMEGPFALVGLFFGEGLHGGEDFRALSDMPGVRRAVTVGDMPGLDDLFETRIRKMLATIPRS